MQVRHVLGWCSFRDPGCPVQEQLGEKRCLLRELGLWEQREQQDVCSDHVLPPVLVGAGGDVTGGAEGVLWGEGCAFFGVQLRVPMFNCTV